MSTAKRGLQKIAEEEEEIPTSKQTKAERDKFKALKEEKENEDNNKVANTEEDGEKKVVEGEEEEEEEEEDEYANPEDFKKVEQAENMINSIMKDKALEYKFLLEIKAKNYDEAEFIAAQILAKSPNNESVLLFWDLLRKHKYEFYEMDEEEEWEDEEEEEETEVEEEEIDEYDYNDGEEYEDEYEVEDDEDGWKTEDEYDEEDEEDEEEEEEEEEEEGEEEEEILREEGGENEEEELEQIKEEEEQIERGLKDKKKIIEGKIQGEKEDALKKKTRNLKSAIPTSAQVKGNPTSATKPKNSSLNPSFSDQIVRPQSSIITKNVKPAVRPLTAMKPATVANTKPKAQSISSAQEIKKILDPPKQSNVQKPPSNIRPQSSIVNSTVKRPSSVSKNSAQTNQDIKLPLICNPEANKLGQNQTKSTVPKRPASKDSRASKSLTSALDFKQINKK